MHRSSSSSNAPQAIANHYSPVPAHHSTQRFLHESFPTPKSARTHNRHPNKPLPNTMKGQSLNHLLNFSLPPRHQKPPPSHLYSHTKSNNKHSKSPKPKVWFSKDRFINANFRFVVKPEGEYSEQVFNPDIPIPWDLIDQVIMPTSDIPACPICLSLPPVAPRISKCGHVYCLPCLLQYHTIEPYEVSRRPDPVNVTQFMQTWRKCPICYDLMYKADMRPVRLWTLPMLPKRNNGIPPDVLQYGLDRVLALDKGTSATTTTKKRSGKAKSTEPPVDPNFEYELMVLDPEYARVAAGVPLTHMHLTRVTKNPANPSLLQPVDLPVGLPISKLIDSKVVPGALLPNVEHMGGLGFSRLMVSTAAYMKNEIWTRDLVEIQNEMQRSSDLATPYLLKKNASSAAAESFQQSVMFFQLAIDSLSSLIHLLAKEPSPSSTKHHHSNPKQHPLPPSQRPASGTSTEPLYMATDGSHTYLHPFDANILSLAFDGTETRHPPAHIDVPVLNVQDTTITHQVRTKFPSLSHLPLGCDVTLIECDVEGFLNEYKKIAVDQDLQTIDSAIKACQDKLNERHGIRIHHARRRALSAKADHEADLQSPPLWEIPHDPVVRSSDTREPLQHSHEFTSHQAPHASKLSSPSFSQIAQRASSSTSSSSSQFTVHGTQRHGAADLSSSAFAIDLFEAIRETTDDEEGSHHDEDHDDLDEYHFADIHLRRSAQRPKQIPAARSSANQQHGKRKGSQAKQKPTVIALNASHRSYK